MFQHILVPLDGSARAERAIPVAARIARATGGSIVLLQVVAPQNEYSIYSVQSTIITPEEVEVTRTHAADYLKAVALKDDLEGVGVHTEVLIGSVAPTLCSFAQSSTADLIVLCSHGYTGLKRWFLGSVADVVTRTAPVPVLILREGGPLPMEAALNGGTQRALVPVDGSPLSEAAIEPAAQLIAALAAPGPAALHLLRVVKFPDRYGHTKSQANIELEMIEQAVQASQAYLTSLMERLQKGTIGHLNLALSASVESGSDVAGAIIETGERTENGCGLMAMSTHGRSGWGRWVIGSITERVLHSSKLPLFVVRPQQLATQKEETREQAGAIATAQSEPPAWVGLL
jgi:nucleotide-binding universal stress UspA family protein